MHPKQAAELAESLLGPGIGKCRAFGSGKFSETFTVTRTGGSHFVLRVAPPDSLLQLFYEYRMMRREPPIHRRLRAETSVPVPEIAAFDFSRRFIDRDFLVMPRLPGNPLSAAGLEPEAERRAFFEWGRYVEQVHRLVQPEGLYGYLEEPHSMEPQGSWREAFHVMFRKELEDVAGCGLYDRETAQSALKLFRKHLGVFDECRKSRLCHGDLWVTNLLVQPDGRVTGLLDFDRACWGDVEWDFAIAEYCGVTRPEFWKGYGRRLETRRGKAAVRRFFYRLYEHQKYIVISMSARRSDPSGARRYADESLAAMEYFRRTGEPLF